jgi:hypothetical protein
MRISRLIVGQAGAQRSGGREIAIRRGPRRSGGRPLGKCSPGEIKRLLLYWLLFGYFAIGAAVDSGRGGAGKLSAPLLFSTGIILIALMIGLRFEVGGDWFAYVRIFQHANYVGFTDALSSGDPAYQALNWIVARLGIGLWLVNLICGSIFALGLSKLSRLQPNPWLAALVAVPYMAIVIAMGYTRQGVALGILMLGFASISANGSWARFALYVVAATLFHKTAMVALPIAALATGRSRLINFVLILVLTYFLYSTFLSTSMDKFVRNYVQSEYSSQGATIRVMMNLVPALLFLISSVKKEFEVNEFRLWRNFSVAAVIAPLFLIFFPSSTVVDRLSLYLTPLQVAVLSRPSSFKLGNRSGTIIIILYCFLVQFVWLNYAEHAGDWVPYRLFPFGETLTAPRG